MALNSTKNKKIKTKSQGNRNIKSQNIEIQKTSFVKRIGRQCRFIKTRTKQSNNDTQTMHKIQFPSSFKSKDNDYQSEILQDDSAEYNQALGNNYPTQIPMISYVLKYHAPNKNGTPKEYDHHIHNNSYVKKLNQPIFLGTINLNHIKFEPYATLAEDNLATKQETNMDPVWK